jgi:hypothetical protein
VAPTKSRHPLSIFLFASVLLLGSSAHAQQPTTEVPKTPATPAEPQIPAQIDLLETKIRFESNGDSRKEVHCIVKINSELGVRQFARLNFDYNRSFEKIEIPLVRVTHSNGGVADVLPSAISDNPNPAVVNAPAYQDVRVKSVRILGLAPSDTLEYRVITTVTKHPLAPDFWLDHSFDRTGVVSHELFELDLPAPRLRIEVNPNAPPDTTQRSGEGEGARVTYRWNVEKGSYKELPKEDATNPDVSLTTYSSWCDLSARVNQIGWPGFSTGIWSIARRLAGYPREPVPPRVLYDFVSRKIATVDVSLEFASSVRRTTEQVLRSGYGTELEKAQLLADLLSQNSVGAVPLMYGRGTALEHQLPRPSLLSGALVHLHEKGAVYFLNVGIAVAPFGLLQADLRGRRALTVCTMPAGVTNCFVDIPENPPFPATQKVTVDASISAAGELRAKVKYAMRGDNELLLRVAFHQSPREKWNEVAQLLALSDGFRGKVENVSASDPYATKDPFTVEYEISQPKFVDWSKKPVRIPAILPLVGLPDPPAKATAPIELGTPLDVTTTVTLHLPPDTTVESPAGTAVDRDYAKFSSTYAATGNTLTAARRIQFLLRQLPANRALEYNTFLRAVQNDQSQRFTLFRPDPAPAPANPATPPQPRPQSPTP